MSDQQDTFLREVQEEVRRDRMAKLLDKYGVLALIVCGVLVGGIAGYKWYEAYQRDNQAKRRQLRGGSGTSTFRKRSAVG